MEISTPQATRRSTRLRVEIPLVVTSLDRRHVFAGECTAVVVGPQGCGLRASEELPLETPVLLSNLPGGGSASGRVASCLPLGKDGKCFLIGVAMYNHGNVWGIADPPADWNVAQGAAAGAGDAGKTTSKGNQEWPYNIFSHHSEGRPGRK